jgi:hypothetical protein
MLFVTATACEPRHRRVFRSCERSLGGSYEARGEWKGGRETKQQIWLADFLSCCELLSGVAAEEEITWSLGAGFNVRRGKSKSSRNNPSVSCKLFCVLDKRQVVSVREQCPHYHITLAVAKERGR